MSPVKSLSTLLVLLPLFLTLQTFASPILTLRARQPSQPVFGTERYRRSPSSGPLSAAEHLRARLPSPAALSVPQLYSATPRLRPVLPAPTFRQWDPVDPYRAFVEQELLEQPEQGSLQDSLDDAYYAEGPYAEGRAATRMSTEAAQSPFVISPGYLQYNPAVSAFRPAATSWRSQERWRASPADPVDDLEEEMRREEDAMGWGTPRWSDSDVDEEDEDEEAEEEAEAEAEAAAEAAEAERRRQAEEEAERAKTEGAFLRNLILAQRYREDALSQAESSATAGRKAYRLSSKRGTLTTASRRPQHQSSQAEPDRAVRELESLAGKGNKRSPGGNKAAATASPPTPAPVKSTSVAPTVAAAAASAQKGQKEVAVPRPASPPRRPLPVEPVTAAGGPGGKWGKDALVAASSKGAVLEALERLLEQEREPMRHRLVGSSVGHVQKKRYASGEDAMLRQLNELKHA
ncbi:eukaryotic translation initiation factor 3 subunit A-like [Ischnura elegans]|uniref:eukaryotic translation initiation factor 3 subunit A-like n=1 Tax=Ischnura elegans TaxID=197161 RepID=UPI001ED86FB0|nr:eukaryotic translation initiation factor 3 subunit A-like [Ischnura elegans]